MLDLVAGQPGQDDRRDGRDRRRESRDEEGRAQAERLQTGPASAIDTGRASSRPVNDLK
ncbi:hypothetical protein [Nocardioides sp. YIM 152315]|uniref:hypothetical protein n=1 Tax=Nocardioides sp. YIM 152315 TaxID=3031760 RepID=UPI0023DC4525|nr:hypothetical protein [Nocardioides sp. YIM 152315]MDF1604367.1 hypothetical protein [Nocardioides sp. YIM 152315]